MSAARIGKITLKAGGAEVRVLRQALPNDGENYRGLLMHHARSMTEDSEELIGFVVVGLYASGTYRSGIRVDPEAVIGRTLLPAYVAEVVRRGVLMEPIADGVI